MKILGSEMIKYHARTLVICNAFPGYILYIFYLTGLLQAVSWWQRLTYALTQRVD